MNLLEALATANATATASTNSAPARALAAFDPLVCNKALARIANAKAFALARLSDPEGFVLEARVRRASAVAAARDVLDAPLGDALVIETARRAQRALSRMSKENFETLAAASASKGKAK